MLTNQQLIIVVIFLLAYWIYSQQPQLKTTQQTQAELTAEQIAQMEKALTEQTTKITALTSAQTELTNQLNHKEVEINQLKEKTKDLEPNPVETRLISIASGVDWNQDNWKNFENQLETGKISSETIDWNQLRAPYSQIRNNLLTYAKTALKQAELEAEIEKAAKVRQELQTKYDLEVRSKEELVKELQSIWPRVISEEEKFVLQTLKDYGYRNNRQKAKELLDQAGFDRYRLGNLGNTSFPFSGAIAYYYLYYDWTVPSDWK